LSVIKFSNLFDFIDKEALDVGVAGFYESALLKYISGYCSPLPGVIISTPSGDVKCSCFLTVHAMWTT
jgi:hypothetical protein